MKEFQGDIYKKHSFQCSCGHVHESGIREVIIQSGGIDELPSLAKRICEGREVLIVTDVVIYEVIGREEKEKWEREGLNCIWQVFKTPVLPDEHALGSILAAMSKDTDLLVAFGAGSVTDLTRYVAAITGRPFIVIPTAMSHDGFFTDMALLLIGGMKSTLIGDVPAALLADTDIIKKAPPRMNIAGVGEMASKYTAVADWYAASLIRGDYYCGEIEELMTGAIEQAFAASDGVREGDTQSILSLTDSLYKSATGMNWYGSARCGAGAEHHLTHYWVMCHANRGEKPNMHGEEVGVGAIIILDMWEKMLSIDEKTFDVEKALDAMPSKKEWEENVRIGYGDAAEEAFKAQKNKTFDREERREEIRKILENLPAMREKFRFLPTYKELAARLKAAGAPYLPEHLHVTREELENSILYAKEVRSKYTSLWIADALGMLPELSKELADDMEALKSICLE